MTSKWAYGNRTFAASATKGGLLSLITLKYNNGEMHDVYFLSSSFLLVASLLVTVSHCHPAFLDFVDGSDVLLLVCHGRVRWWQWNIHAFEHYGSELSLFAVSGSPDSLDALLLYMHNLLLRHWCCSIISFTSLNMQWIQGKYYNMY